MSESKIAIFAISDLHLLGNDDKSMEIFGANWANHWDKIRSSWLSCVNPEDLVLIPGDISWAMYFEDAMGDLSEIGALPGKKVIMRGNHDYWWSSIGKLRSALPEGMYAVQNDCLLFDDVAVCGTRGWTCPSDGEFGAENEKLYLREGARLELSLKELQRKRGDRLAIAMMHYPPFNERREDSIFTKLLEQYQVDVVLYGHLHGGSLRNVFEGMRNGIRYEMVSCDYLRFQVKKIL